MIRPAIMFLAGQGHGLVRLPNGQILSQFGQGSNMPFLATWSCTAFVVNPDGWVATAGHCVDPESAKLLILKRAAAEYIAQYPDAPESRDPSATLDWLQKNARVEGDNAGRGPEVSLTLLYGTGAHVAGKIPANVVDFRPLGKGDVALLKIDSHNLPSSELATDADVSIGTSVLSVGFAESTQNVTGPSLDPTNKSGKVSKKSRMGSSPEYEIDAAVTEGMSGGPTIELNGKVIGVNSFAPVGESQPFNFIAPADSLAAIMASKGVKAMLGPADVLLPQRARPLLLGPLHGSDRRFRPDLVDVTRLSRGGRSQGERSQPAPAVRRCIGVQRREALVVHRGWRCPGARRRRRSDLHGGEKPLAAALPGRSSWTRLAAGRA